MNLTKLSLSLVFLILAQSTFSLFVYGQNKTRRQADTPLQRAAPRMDVYQILDQTNRLSEEARGLQPQEDEIRLQAGLADSVWAIDQALGKRLLLRSFDLTVAFLEEKSRPANPRPTPVDPNLLFRQISSIAARHDPKLERHLIERWENNIRSIGDRGDKSKADPAQLSSLLLSQSSRILKEQRQRAILLFRESVSLRVLPDHSFFLMNQRTQDAAFMDSLFGDALAILGQRPITEANELLVLASYLFSPDNSIAYTAISGYNTANVAGNVSAVPKNTTLAKQYLALLLAKLNPTESIPSDVVYFALKNLVPQYAALAPEHLQDVYAKLGTLGTNVSSSNRSGYESAFTDFTASEADAITTWEKRVQGVDKIEDSGRRDLEYFTIILSYLLPKRDFAQATQLANSIYNDDLRHTLTDLVSLRSLQSGLQGPEAVPPPSDGHWEKITAKINDPLLKVVALSTVAQARINERSTGDAILLLDQAREEAKRIDSDQDRLQVQLMLTQLYLRGDSGKGFETAVQAFKAINKFPDFNFRRSTLAVRASVYGFTNQLPIELPTSSSLILTVEKMCRVNCVEAFESCRLLERKHLRLWAMFQAIRTALLDSEQRQKTATSNVSSPS